MLELGLACDGGKDSLSMAANAGGEVVMAPGNLVRFWHMHALRAAQTALCIGTFPLSALSMCLCDIRRSDCSVICSCCSAGMIKSCWQLSRIRSKPLHAAHPS